GGLWRKVPHFGRAAAGTGHSLAGVGIGRGRVVASATRRAETYRTSPATVNEPSSSLSTSIQQTFPSFSEVVVGMVSQSPWRLASWARPRRASSSIHTRTGHETAIRG